MTSDSNYKMVFCVRKDLQMGKGKIAAQCCHAAIDLYVGASKSDLTAWKKSMSRKVVLSIADEKEMEEIFEKAKTAGLNRHIVTDAGLTQIDPGSKTVLGIGPASAEEIDKITGHLKLL